MVAGVPQKSENLKVKNKKPNLVKPEEIEKIEETD